MRISTNMAFDNFIFRQQVLQGSMYSVMNQINTGQSVVSTSDDPVAASQILKFNDTLENQNQLLENIRYAGDFMNAADAALSQVSELVMRVQQLASGAVGSLTVPEERQAAATEIDTIIQQLVNIGNTQHLDQYIFSGRDVTKKPVLEELGGIRYVGDTGTLRARLAEDEDDEFSLTADDVFAMLSGEVKGSVDLNPALTLDTRLDELNGANNLGIRLGGLRFVEDTGVEFSVDLTNATSIGQVIDLINQAAEAAGSDLRADINATLDGLVITPGNAVVISATDNGVIASDLGIVTNIATANPIIGKDLNRKLTPTARISDLMGGAGIDFANNTFRIRNGDHVISVDLTTATTVQDILNTITNLGIGVRATINDAATGINIQNEISGTVMSIEEEGGTAASLLGLRSLDTTTALADLNFGEGVSNVAGEDDFEIVSKDGTSFNVNIDDAKTVQDVLDCINAAATAAGVAVTASLATTGNGIRIVDATGGNGALAINPLNNSLAVSDLGLDGTIDSAATEVTGRDVNGVRVDGLFAALIDLRNSLLRDTGSSNSDEIAITDAAQRVDDSFIELTRVEGMLGAQIRAMETRTDLTQQAVDATSSLLAQVRDLDYASAITKFQQTQTALQASLMASGQMVNLSLLNYLS